MRMRRLVCACAVSKPQKTACLFFSTVLCLQIGRLRSACTPHSLISEYCYKGDSFTISKISMVKKLKTQGLHRLEKYLNKQDCLEKSLKIKFALKSTWIKHCFLEAKISIKCWCLYLMQHMLHKRNYHNFTLIF